MPKLRPEQDRGLSMVGKGNRGALDRIAHMPVGGAQGGAPPQLVARMVERAQMADRARSAAAVTRAVGGRTEPEPGPPVEDFMNAKTIATKLHVEIGARLQAGTLSTAELASLLSAAGAEAGAPGPEQAPGPAPEGGEG